MVTVARDAELEPESALSYRYLYLLHFDRCSALPFYLQDVIEDAWSPMAQSGAITDALISLLDKLNNDFGNCSRITPLFVHAAFVKAQRHNIEDLEEVKGLMGSYAVTTASVMQACLRNDCRSTIPIQYGIANVVGFTSHLQTFVHELLDALLFQPYRGVMLRELDRFFAQEDLSIDSRRLLASAVEDQGEFESE